LIPNLKGTLNQENGQSFNLKLVVKKENKKKLFSLGAHKQNKKENNEHWLVVVFSGSIKTKQKKMTTIWHLSSSSLGAHKKNKKRR
jgi:hypothetical protein